MKRSAGKVMARLVGLVRPLAGYMTASVVMGTVGYLCATLITVFSGYAVLSVIGHRRDLSLLLLCIGMVLCAVFRAILKYGEQGCNHYIAFRLLALIRDRIFQVMRKLAPAKMEGKDKGDLISLITSDVELLEVFYAHTISPICIAVVYTLIMLVMIGRYHFLLALLALSSYLVIGVALPLLTNSQSGDIGMEVRENAGRLATVVLDNIRGLSESLRYQDTERRLQVMHEETDQLLDAQEEEKYLAGRSMAISGLLINLFDIMMIVAAIVLYWQGQLNFEGVLIPVLTFMSSFGPVSALAALGSTLQNTIAAGNRVLDILDEEPIINEISGQTSSTAGDLKAEYVSFAYPDGEMVLNDVSMRIPYGKIIGISGPSGSGKSTLLKLLMRFWKPQTGRITVGEKDLEEINTADLRAMESYMTQDTWLFHDTIRNNLLIAKPSASEEELQEACRKAAIHDFIMALPEGYDTMIGELGDTLSGGEKQRLGLARAFLHQSDVILLDEPTSNLDSLNEGMILKALKEGTDRQTVVLVSHRPSALRICEEVYAMDEERAS
ncbi:MAG: thiol reductant ABC exporter subunit CydC [Solobacterium sp.]|nr:thiol reductant ABC exporter subunit CydC [Solobacterium sp.]